MKRILIVDGDMAVRAQIGRYARLEGYDVAEASDGYTAVALFRQSTFDFVILAVMLPELDGFSVCQTIRSFSQVPILILSERGDEADRIRGLELGADDYVVKPFSPRELMLRISAIMKRGPLLDSMRQRSIEQDGIYIDLIARRVMVDGNQVSLTPKEFDDAGPVGRQSRCGGFPEKDPGYRLGRRPSRRYPHAGYPHQAGPPGHHAV